MFTNAWLAIQTDTQQDCADAHRPAHKQTPGRIGDAESDNWYLGGICYLDLRPKLIGCGARRGGFSLNRDACALKAGCRALQLDFARLLQRLNDHSTKAVKDASPRFRRRRGLIRLVAAWVAVPNAQDPPGPRQLEADFIHRHRNRAALRVQNFDGDD